MCFAMNPLVNMVTSEVYLFDHSCKLLYTLTVEAVKKMLHGPGAVVALHADFYKPQFFSRSFTLVTATIYAGESNVFYVMFPALESPGHKSAENAAKAILESASLLGVTAEKLVALTTDNGECFR